MLEKSNNQISKEIKCIAYYKDLSLKFNNLTDEFNLIFLFLILKIFFHLLI